MSSLQVRASIQISKARGQAQGPRVSALASTELLSEGDQAPTSHPSLSLAVIQGPATAPDPSWPQAPAAKSLGRAVPLQSKYKHLLLVCHSAKRANSPALPPNDRHTLHFKGQPWADVRKATDKRQPQEKNPKYIFLTSVTGFNQFILSRQLP